MRCSVCEVLAEASQETPNCCSESLDKEGRGLLTHLDLPGPQSPIASTQDHTSGFLRYRADSAQGELSSQQVRGFFCRSGCFANSCGAFSAPHVSGKRACSQPVVHGENTYIRGTPLLILWFVHADCFAERRCGSPVTQGLSGARCHRGCTFASESPQDCPSDPFNIMLQALIGLASERDLPRSP